MTIADEVQGWKDRIARAEEYLKENDRVTKWEQHRKWYQNAYDDQNAISVNLIFSIGRALVPQLYFKAPTILVVPEKPVVCNMAPVIESIDKQLIKQMGMKWQLKLAIVDAFLTNLAVFKFGYHSISTEFPNERKNDVSAADIGEAVMDLFGDQALADEASKEEEEMQRYSYHDWVKPDSPWMLLVQPQDFLIPKGCRNIYEAPWCAFRVVRNVEDVKADPVYGASFKKDLKPNVSLESKKTTGVQSPNLEKGKSGKLDEELVEFFEVWDKRTGEVLVVSEDVQVFGRKEKHNLNMTGLPVEVLQYNPVSWDFWGESDVTQIYKQVLELGETRTLEMKHKRVSVAKTGVDKNKVDDNEIKKMTSGEIAVFKVDGDPNTATANLSHNMTRDLYNISDVVRNDVSELLGFSRNQAGDYDVSRRTATEASIVQHSIQLRSDERRDQIGDFVSDAFSRKIHPMIFDLWEMERVIEVARMPKELPPQMQVEGYPNWVKFTGKQVRGDYQISVIADSVVPMTKMERRQTAKETYAMFKGDLRINQRKLYEFVLAQYDGVFPEGLLLSEEDYVKIVMQQLQMMAGAPQAPAEGGGNGKARVPVSGVQK